MTSARIIQVAPYWTPKQEQEVERLLARLIRPSPLADCGDIRARVAVLVEWSAALNSSKPRTHFKHTIEGHTGEIVETIAGVDGYELADAAWLAAINRWPRRHHPAPGARVVRDSRHPRLVK